MFVCVRGVFSTGERRRDDRWCESRRRNGAMKGSKVRHAMLHWCVVSAQAPSPKPVIKLSFRKPLVPLRSRPGARLSSSEWHMSRMGETLGGSQAGWNFFVMRTSLCLITVRGIGMPATICRDKNPPWQAPAWRPPLTSAETLPRTPSIASYRLRGTLVWRWTWRWPAARQG